MTLPSQRPLKKEKPSIPISRHEGLRVRLRMQSASASYIAAGPAPAVKIGLAPHMRSTNYTADITGTTYPREARIRVTSNTKGTRTHLGSNVCLFLSLVKLATQEASW